MPAVRDRRRPSSHTQKVARCIPSIGHGRKKTSPVSVLRPHGLPELVLVAPRADEEEVEALSAPMEDDEAELTQSPSASERPASRKLAGREP